MVAENATGQSKKLLETEKGGGKSIKFLNGLFMTNSDLNVSRLSLWGVYLKYIIRHQSFIVQDAIRSH